MGSPRLYLMGGLASLAFAGALVAQQVIGLIAGEPADELLARLSTLDQTRAAALWVSFWGLPIAYYALFRVTSERPNWARLGLGASIWFVACELCYRTIELFVVTRGWTAQWNHASGAARAALAERIALWDELVVGWYVMLVLAHAIGLAAFAVAIGWRRGWLDRLACVTQAAYAISCVLRLASYVVPALDPVCAALFFPTAMPAFAAAGALLLRAHRQANAVSAR